jgi:hypothetical protein
MTDYLDKPIRQSLKNIVRPSLIRLTTIHKPGSQSDIAIVSSPRSGSTWLMETIATQPGMKYINEPDHKELLEYYHALNIVPRGIWLSLALRERQDLAHYLLEDRRSGLFGPANPFARNHSWRTSRRVLKLIRMNPVVEWLDSLGFATVYLLRHPIPQAQSCIKRDHRLILDEVLADELFLRYLGPEVASYVGRIYANGDLMLQYITQWCVENIVGLTSPLAGKSFTLTTHELLVTNPLKEMERLAGLLRLENIDLLLKRISEPSRTTDSSSTAAVESIRAGESARLLEMWRRDLTQGEERRLMEPLRVFGINLYKVGEILPDIPQHWAVVPEMFDGPVLPVTAAN